MCAVRSYDSVSIWSMEASVVARGKKGAGIMQARGNTVDVDWQLSCRTGIDPWRIAQLGNQTMSPIGVTDFAGKIERQFLMVS